MIVTDIEKLQNGKLRIYLNDEPAFLLYEKEAASNQIRIGIEMDESRILEIHQTILSKRAKLRAMNILKSRDKTEYQLRQKLQEGEYPQEIIDEALEYVKSYHYIDDDRYARNYIEYKKNSKSRRQIDFELSGKGISQDVIEAVWEEIGPSDVTEQILRYAQKRHVDLHNTDSDEYRKFYQFLLRKGFLSTDIKKALT